MDSFRVYTIGGNGTEKYKYTVSDPSILSIIGNNDSCYFRGLKSGTCQIKIECISELNPYKTIECIKIDFENVFKKIKFNAFCCKYYCRRR